MFKFRYIYSLPLKGYSSLGIFIFYVDERSEMFDQTQKLYFAYRRVENRVLTYFLYFFDRETWKIEENLIK